MSTSSRKTVRVADLAEVKGLDADWLRKEIGLRDVPRGVEIPYYDDAGETIAEKLRSDLIAKKGSFWPKGVPLRPYGMWRLHEARRLGYLILVEGESDCWALWRHGLPALGIPGASAAKVLCVEHVDGIGTIHVHKEPGSGGEAFVAGVKQRLAVCGWTGQLLLLTMSGFKDPADLQKASPRLFAASIKERLDAAELLTLAPAAAAQPGNGHVVGNVQASAGAAVSGLEWEPPVPLGDPSAPKEFPLEALPEPIAEYVRQCAWATNSPPDFVAVPLLVMAAGCIGASRVLAITPDHIQPAILFAVVVGAPGGGKSPALLRVREPLQNADRRQWEKWRRELDNWSKEDPDTRPKDKPRLQRLQVDNATGESLLKALGDNPRGLVMIRDELNALVAGMNQYKSKGGDERQIYLSIWSGSPVIVDRKSNLEGLPLIVWNPALSIIGGVQPDILENFMAGGNDGFLDRFLFSYPADMPAVGEQFRAVEPGVQQTWHDAVQWLLSLEQWRESDGHLRAKVVKFSPAAMQAWVDFTARHAAEVNNPEFLGSYRGPWSKLRGYCARLALVLHYLGAAADADHRADDAVNEEAVLRAACLTDYFKAHWIRATGRMLAEPRREEAGKLLAWLSRRPELKRFSRGEIYRQYGYKHFRAPDAMDRALALLGQHHFVREVEVDRGLGKKSTAVYDANPLWVRIAEGANGHSRSVQ